MKILVSYRGIPQSPGWATGDMVVKAFRALGHEAYSYAKYYQENRWVEGRPPLDDHDWDLILYMECNDGDPQYHELKVVRARKVACWLFDTSYYNDRCKGLVDYFRFDNVFLANPLTIREYKVWGYDNVDYLPYACDPELHGRPLEYPKTHNVALVGSIRDDRRALARELFQHRVDLSLIGNVFREQYIDALASARIVVNQNPNVGRGLLNMRFWEAQAAGSYVVTEKEDFVVNAEFLKPCIVGIYRNTSELARICNMLLGSVNDKTYSLTDVCKSVQKYVFDNHTYQNRCEELLTKAFPHG